MVRVVASLRESLFARWRLSAEPTIASVIAC